MRPLHIYVAGPIGKNDEGRRRRVEAALDVGRQLLRHGLCPFVPHLWAAALADADDLLGYEEWLKYDTAWINRCDAVLRMRGESPGADREVAFAEERGIRVFYSIDALLTWRDCGAPVSAWRVFERWGTP